MKRKIVLAAVASLFVLVSSGVAFAANTPTFNQTISGGALSTDVLNASRVSVASPSATLSAKAYSFDCQTGGLASTGTLGTTSEREYVMNPGAANLGWTLTIAATGGTTSLWTSGGNTFDFNDAGTSGCSDTPTTETDTKAGQLTINPAVGTLTTDCISCTVANISKGSSATFVEGTTNSITLLNAALASDDVWRGYVYGSALSQTVPAEQSAGAYTLGMTLTVTAS